MNILGFPVRVDVSFWMTTAFVAFTSSRSPALVATWIGVVFVSVLLHELGHALAGRAFGLSSRITLYGMGGLTTFERGRAELTPRRSILVSLAGPGMGFLFGAAVFAAYAIAGSGRSPVVRQAFEDLLWVNIGWGAINLLPMLPLDGGNVARSVEHWVRGPRSETIARALSVVTGVAAIGLALYFRMPIAAVIVAIFGYQNVTWFAHRRGERADENLRPSLDRAWREVNGEGGGDPVRTAERALAAAKSQAAKREALQLLAYARANAGDAEGARDAVNMLQGLYGPMPEVEGYVLVAAGDDERAIGVLEPAFSSHPTPLVGQLLARALVRSGRHDEALALARHPALAASAADVVALVRRARGEDEE